jgi:hypothetical protein
MSIYDTIWLHWQHLGRRKEINRKVLRHDVLKDEI